MLRWFHVEPTGPVIGPMFTADGVAYNGDKSLFFDVDGFTEITGSGDYTIMAWYKYDTLNGNNRVLIYHQDDMSTTTKRFSFLSTGIETGAGAGAESFGLNVTNRNANEPQCIVLKKEAGTSAVFYLINGVFESYTGLSIPDRPSSLYKSVGGALALSLNKTNLNGQILSLQITNTAL